MALDDWSGLGVIGTVGGALADIVLNSGEIILTLVTLLISSPDIWLTIVTGARRIADMAGFSTSWFQPLIVAGTVLMMIISIQRFIARWRSET